MDIKQIPKKYKLNIRDVVQDKVFGNEFADAVDSAISDCENWKDFQSVLFNDMQSYIDDAKRIQNILCR